MSADLWFVDTNVLVCAFDVESPEKQKTARQLLDAKADQLVLSTQVLGEFYVTVTRKLAKPLPPDRAVEALDALGALPVRGLARRRWCVPRFAEAHPHRCPTGTP